MISDYCQGDKDEYSKDFITYVEERGYFLHTVKEYGSLLQKVLYCYHKSLLTLIFQIFIQTKVGFANVVADDRTKQFIDILNNELERFDEQKSEFLHQFNEHDFDYIVSGWQAKLVRCASGDQAWGLFTATKPLV